MATKASDTSEQEAAAGISPATNMTRAYPISVGACPLVAEAVQKEQYLLVNWRYPENRSVFRVTE